MKSRLRLQIGGLFLALLVLSVVVPVFKLLTYKQVDNEIHLKAKQQYLEQLKDSTPKTSRPNIVLIVLDDLGYGDIGAYGSKSIATPNIDSLAKSGIKFTQYYSPSPVCSPARAGIMTGRYPPRAGLGHVVFPENSFISNWQKIFGINVRIPAEEIILPEVLEATGYNTGMVGKWHMGDVSPSLPNDFGFESFYGAHYSNDMKPFLLYRDRDIEEAAELDQTRLNSLYTGEIIKFIEKQNGEEPFFLYYAHNFPHIPLYSSPEQEGKSKAGLYGDVVEDIDRSIGALLDALSRKEFMDNTIIVFTSDNGPWFQGSNGDSRGRKNQTWEGGMRVPFIVHWPEAVPSSRILDAPVSGVDIFPTLLDLLNIQPPKDRIIDGQSILPLLTGTGTWSAKALFFYSMNGTTLDAVRDEHFKYHRRRGVRASDFFDRMSIFAAKGPWLFDMKLDPQESYNVADKYTMDRLRLVQVMSERNAETTINPRGWIETNLEARNPDIRQ